MSRLAAALMALILALTLAPAARAETDSIYTDLNLDECLVLDADDFGAQWACPGFSGMPLWVAEGDLRMFVSFGFGAPEEMAATQTLPRFNTVNSTLEWRVSNENGEWFPFATILRWFTQIGDGSEPDGQILVVTKIEPGNTCHIGYVDARATSEANVLARQIADLTAAGFNCITDSPVRLPEGAMIE